MARRDNRDAGIKKELWDHFKPGEMETLAAYCYKFDAYLPDKKIKVNKDKDTGEMTIDKVEQNLPKYSVDNFHAARPWTVYERFRRAYRIFDRIMRENPLQRNNFAIADIQEDGSIDSGSAVLEPKLREQSKEVWNSLFGRNGEAWGDEAKLKSYVAGHGGKVCKSYGFKECDVPPFSMVERSMDSMGMDEEDNVGPGMDIENEKPKAEEDKPHRGRPRKEAVA